MPFSRCQAISLAVFIVLSGTSCSSGNDPIVASGPRDAGTLEGGARPLDAGSQRPDNTESDTGTQADCAWADATTERLPATVWLVIEKSSSMRVPLSAPTLTRVRNALIGPEGLIVQNEADFSFGAVVHGGNRQVAACPMLSLLDPGPSLANSLADLLDTTPEATDAPQGSYALGLVHSRLPVSGAGGPNVVVMVRYAGDAYDLPCERDDATGMGNVGAMLTYKEAQALVEAGVKLFIVDFNPPFLGGFDDNIPGGENESEKLAEIADTGHGPFYIGAAPSQAGDQDDLVRALEQILADSVSCEFGLNGEVKPGMECDGEVSIDGELRPCNDSDGWRMKDSRTVELVGRACDDLRAKASAQVKARFPCEAFVVF